MTRMAPSRVSVSGRRRRHGGGVDFAPVSAPLGLEPGENIGVETDGEERIEPGEADLSGAHVELAFFLVVDGSFEFLLGHRIDPSPVGQVFAALDHLIDLRR